MDLIEKYFPEISPEHIDMLKSYLIWLEEKNEAINLISRKDSSQILLHHISHSLVINKLGAIQPKMMLLDIGTGGGLPGIPLAITNPDTEFHLIDSIRKKTTAVSEAIEILGLKNVKCTQMRAEKEKGNYDLIVSRAVARLNKLWNWSRPLLNGRKHNALICLKGGELSEEIAEINKQKVDSFPVQEYVAEPYFDSKYIIKVTA